MRKEINPEEEEKQTKLNEREIRARQKAAAYDYDYWAKTGELKLIKNKKSSK